VAKLSLDGLIDYLKGIFADRKRRNIIILSILIIIFLIILLNLTGKEKDFKRSRFILCPECHYTGVVEVERIEDIRCPQCNSKVGYDWKCIDCEFEFPLIRREIPPGKMSKKELIKYRIRESKCPKCGSLRTFPKKLKK
jgi:DNA-directed RNA polymerase subunit RPC12/RpoP